MRNLESRIEALERQAGIGQPEREAIFIVHVLVGDQTSRLVGYSWRGGKAIKKPGESDNALLSRAEKEARPFLEPWGGIVLDEIRQADIQ